MARELGLGGGLERRLLLEQLARLTVRGQLSKLDREEVDHLVRRMERRVKQLGAIAPAPVKLAA